MCGIAGFNWQDRQLIEQMTQDMRHRGPDDEGIYVDGEVSLGHRRLSVIDLSPRGHQPMSFRNLVITYNGEVFNYRALRDELRQQGYEFTSDTDTEVIVAAYHRWGPQCVMRFHGMWAFCIYDKDNRTLFLSRDRFGIKPLCYYFDGRRFAFASELKAIRRCPLPLKTSIPAVNYFFYQKYIGGDRTIFENCYKLRPGENLLFDQNSRKLTRSFYYDLEGEIAACERMPLEEQLTAVESTLDQAVEDHLVADVPVGSFLSGGLDSSVISALIRGRHERFETFSIGFRDKSYDELEFSRLVAQHIRTEHYTDTMEIDTDVIQLLLDNMDEPFGDASLFPTYLLSKIARRRVTVCLSGDGADEVFGGYDTYLAYKMARYVPRAAVAIARPLVNALPISDKKVTPAFKFKRFMRDYGSPANRRHLDWMATFNDAQRQELLGEHFTQAETLTPCGSNDSLLSLQLNDIHNYLAEDILKKVDSASMLNSLEVRVPYLDHRLVPTVLSLPERYRIRGVTTKWLLKKIAAGYLPRRIVRRGKRGFTSPISEWIRTKDLIREYLVTRTYYQHDLLNYDLVQRMVGDHLAGTADWARHLWLVFIFNYWRDRNG